MVGFGQAQPVAVSRKQTLNVLLCRAATQFQETAC
jgi:hypothetical protein